MRIATSCFESFSRCGPFLAVAAVSLLTLAVAWVVFHRAEFRFAEEI